MIPTWLRRRGPSRPSRLEALLDRADTTEDPREPRFLIDLVAYLRPRRADRADQVARCSHRIDELIRLLRDDKPRSQRLRARLTALLAQSQHRYWYADTGIVRPEGLWRGTLARLSGRWLPQALHPAYLHDLMRQIFGRPDDSVWLQAVDRERWQRLWTALWPEACVDPEGLECERHGRAEIGEAINVLATRLHAAATDNEVVRLHTDEPYDLDMFDDLGRAAAGLRDALRHERCEAPGTAATQEVLAGTITRCEKELAAWRRLLRRHGTTAALSQQVLAAGQMLARLRALAQIVGDPQPQDRALRMVRLMHKLVEEQTRDSSVVDLWRRTNRMLALQVTEHAGLIGEHYVATTRATWVKMIGAALGAGALVAVMALVKQWIYTLSLPPLPNALAISMNYAIGFVLAHLLHLAIATKQPAMTAALIASTVRASPSGKRSLLKLAALIVAIARTQFIAILSNVVCAFPVALGLYWLMGRWLGDDWLSTDKATHLLHDVEPLQSLALPHAAIAGVCLYLSGVLAGYYNNLTAVTQIPERLLRAPGLRWLGRSARERLADYVRDNLGALVGNASLGFMLGMAGFVGFLLGLPIDVRHVTLSASNLGFGVAALHWDVDTATLVRLSLGILAIGIINLAVSFSMALWTAFSANGIRLRDGSRLFVLIWRHLRRKPSSLLIP